MVRSDVNSWGLEWTHLEVLELNDCHQSRVADTLGSVVTAARRASSLPCLLHGSWILGESTCDG